MNEKLTKTVANLRSFLDAAKLAVTMARIDNPDASGIAGVGWKIPDGSGKLVANFDSEPFCDDLDEVLRALLEDRTREQEEHTRRVIHAGLVAAEDMRAKCAALMTDPELREAILDEALPESIKTEDDGFWRDNPPTPAEVKAHADRRGCNVWAGETQWMILVPMDQTVMAEIVTFKVETYEADLKHAQDQGACAYRPVTIDGNILPWPVVIL